MLPMLLDARPLVRSISCWALSRYSYWIVQASVELNSQGKQQFDTVVAVRFLLLTPAFPPLLLAPFAPNLARTPRVPEAASMRETPLPSMRLRRPPCCSGALA